MILKIVSPTSKYKDASTYDDVVDYVLNPDKSKPHHQLHFGVSIDNPASDMNRVAEEFKKLKGTKVRHTILSFDPKKEAYITYKDALDIAGSACSDYGLRLQLDY